MGEIADMMLSGILCCQCGEALDEEVMDMDMGIPVICSSCFGELPKKDKADFECRNEKFLLSKSNK